jgi:hypothetical protein
MTDEQVLPLLQALSTDRQALKNETLEILWQDGWINVQPTHTMDTPESQRPYVFLSFAEKAERLLKKGNP